MKVLLLSVSLLQYYLLSSSVAGFTTNANNNWNKNNNVVSLKPSSSSSLQYVNSIQRGGGGAAAGAASTASTTTAAPMMSQAIMSVLAGSIGGAVGVGVAFPLDTLKTKSQVLASQTATTLPGTNGTATIDLAAVDVENMNMIQLTKYIYRAEGISGFFGGVKGMMAGQALIKALAFSANTCALLYLEQYKSLYLGSFGVLLVAACFSGFITSFLVTPVERIKLMMQANPQYTNELDCASAVLRTEGLKGLMVRGLGPTLVREVPAYGIYFVVYGLFMETPLADVLGQFAPLLFGALSGMACWIPTYPIDVVKTLVQNTEGGEEEGGGKKKSSMDVAIEIYQEGGFGAFYNGITPKLLRAAINHSVTFYVYGLVMNSMKL